MVNIRDGHERCRFAPDPAAGGNMRIPQSFSNPARYRKIRRRNSDPNRRYLPIIRDMDEPYKSGAIG